MDQEALYSEFLRVAGGPRSQVRHETPCITLELQADCDANQAHRYLEENDWQIHAALQNYYDDMENEREGPDDTGQAAADRVLQSHMKRPNSTADTGNQTASSSSANPSTARKKPPPQKKKFGTLSDLQGNADSGHDDDSDKEQEFYAGGDKSGLAVQDPSQQVNNQPTFRESIQRLIDTARRSV